MTLDEFKRLDLPDVPGVYFFKAGNDILYIGRATSLKDRVRSYFTPDLMKARGPLIGDMVFMTNAVSWQETGSVLEAVILEAALIKKHQPNYNTREKDDKSFNHVVVTREIFPRVLLVRGKDFDTAFSSKDAKYIFGPFPQGGLLKEGLKIIRKIFPYRDEKCFPGQVRPCFNRQIGLCPGVCTGEISAKEYAKIISRIKLFFEGKTSSLVRSLERDMRSYAARKEFEKAGDIKRTLFSLKHIQDIALVRRGDSSGGDSTFRIEGYDVAHISGSHMVGVMVVADGSTLRPSEYRSFNVRGFSVSNDPGALREIITRRLGHPEWPAPDLVVVDGNDVQRGVAVSLFGTVPVVAVTKDERHRPSRIVGDVRNIEPHREAILRLNAEAHRFAISRFRYRSRKGFTRRSR